MVYAQLKDGQLSVSEFHYSGQSITCRYVIVSGINGSSHRFIVDNAKDVKDILTSKSSTLNSYDLICNKLISVILKTENLVGSIEVENV